jgi:hypothetical protein
LKVGVLAHRRLRQKGRQASRENQAQAAAPVKVGACHFHIDMYASFRMFLRFDFSFKPL